jgi:hypothetical protein
MCFRAKLRPRAGQRFASASRLNYEHVRPDARNLFQGSSGNRGGVRLVRFAALRPRRGISRGTYPRVRPDSRAPARLTDVAGGASTAQDSPLRHDAFSFRDRICDSSEPCVDPHGGSCETAADLLARSAKALAVSVNSHSRWRTR